MVGIRRFADWEPACTLIHESFVALKLLTVDCYGAGHDIFEIDILGAIKRQQAELVKDGSHVVGVLDTFALTGPLGSHKCIVMPVLGCSIGTQVDRYDDRRLPVPIMKEITKQVLQGLSFLHSKCEVVHTGNILQYQPTFLRSANGA
ncbi:hypothetical protein LTR15_009212 [Elasticomyces elasticus]|nr:hypothetical protein LTR15_009212 [Elasticomyces elasticus]